MGIKLVTSAPVYLLNLLKLPAKNSGEPDKVKAVSQLVKVVEITNHVLGVDSNDYYLSLGSFEELRKKCLSGNNYYMDKIMKFSSDMTKKLISKFGPRESEWESIINKIDLLGCKKDCDARSCTLGYQSFMKTAKKEILLYSGESLDQTKSGLENLKNFLVNYGIIRVDSYFTDLADNINSSIIRNAVNEADFKDNFRAIPQFFYYLSEALDEVNELISASNTQTILSTYAALLANLPDLGGGVNLQNSLGRYGPLLQLESEKDIYQYLCLSSRAKDSLKFACDLKSKITDSLSKMPDIILNFVSERMQKYEGTFSEFIKSEKYILPDELAEKMFNENFSSMDKERRSSLYI